MKIYLFYGGMLLDKIEVSPYDSISKTVLNTHGNEVWQGGYIYTPDYPHITWWRCDITPVLLEDVPPQLKAQVLLMGI